MYLDVDSSFQQYRSSNRALDAIRSSVRIVSRNFALAVHSGSLALANVSVCFCYILVQLRLDTLLIGRLPAFHSWFQVSADPSHSELDARNTLNQSLPIEADGVLQLPRSSHVSGRYVCVTSNELGETRVESDVQINRHITVRVRPRRVLSERGRREQLNCTVIGKPLDRLLWLKDGQPVDQLGERMRILLLGDQSMLEIDRVQESDVGMYQCVAENELGDSAQEAVHLTLAGESPSFDPTLKWILNRPRSDMHDSKSIRTLHDLRLGSMWIAFDLVLTANKRCLAGPLLSCRALCVRVGPFGSA
jgi:hypothetical protein